MEYSDLEFSDEFHKRARVYIKEIEDYYRGDAPAIGDADKEEDPEAEEGMVVRASMTEQPAISPPH